MNKKVKKGKFRGLSIASLITGLLTIILAPIILFVSLSTFDITRSFDFIVIIFSIVSLALPMVSVVCGGIDLKRIKAVRYSSKGRGFDIAGIVMGGIFILIFLVLPISWAATPAEEEMMCEEGVTTGYMNVAPEEAKKLIDENPDLIIIDVSPKYDDGHLPGAVNYYIGDGSFDDAIPTLDPQAEYLVYCHVDSASIGGAQALMNAGLMNVYRLKGNYAAWVDAGYEVEK
jgi:adenylyltransferase/sulfurtransferase